MIYQKVFFRITCLGIFLLITGCASSTQKSHEPVIMSPTTASNTAADKPKKDSLPIDDILDDNTNVSPPKPVNVDPYEKFNRAMFGFNDSLDHWILRPITKGYDTVTPTFARKRVTNFFNNLDVLVSLPNDFLQGKMGFVVCDFWRFVINSSVGIGGLFDPATSAGLPLREQDFGMTLAYWSGNEGLNPQPYLVLPFLGSTTTRDALGKIPDAFAWPFLYIEPDYYSYGVFALKVVNARANLLPADQLVKQAFDPYIFVRSAYLQTRQQALEKSWHETHPEPVTADDGDVPVTTVEGDSSTSLPTTTTSDDTVTEKVATSPLGL